jgi:hypothetical protein
MAKAKATPRSEVVAIASDRASKTAPQPAPVTDTDIARRAYDLYLARGREDGHDVGDWLQAERELNRTARSLVA